MFQTIYSTAALVALCLVAVFAIWRGGPSEQAAAGMVSAGWVVATFVRYVNVPRFAWWITGVDLLLLIGLTVLAWRSTPDWPPIAAAFQAVAVVTGVLFIMDATIPSTMFIGALSIATFGVLGAIAWGVWTASTRKTAPPASN